MENKTPITPKSKVLNVIEEFPQLEEVLINYVPAFSKLKNPVLRKTVAKVATLQQAAAIAGVRVEELINHLRKEVGQDLLLESSSQEYTTSQPHWFDAEKIVLELNASEMLGQGEHPVNQVMADLKLMNSRSIYKLIAPFLPAPLIDKATSLDVQHWVEKQTDGSFIIYFYKP